MGYRLIAIMVSLLVIVGVTVSLAQVPATEQSPKALDPDVVAVRLLLGNGDRAPQDWSGQVALDRGEIVDVEGVRFRNGDTVTGRDSWKTKSRLIRKAKKAASKAERQAAAVAKRLTGTGPSTAGGSVAPNGVILALKNAAGATLTAETAQGKFSVPIDKLADGAVVSLLNGRANAQRVFPHAPLFEGPNQQDFPAAAASAQGAWVAAVWHEARGPELLPSLREQPQNFAAFAPEGGGDQVRLLHFQNGKAGEPLDVTGPGRDIWRVSVATPDNGGVIILWTEKRDGNWDLYCRRYDPHAGSFGPEQRVTDGPGTDTDGVLAAAGGTVWLAWQAWNDSQADILLAPLDATGKLGAAPIRITDTPANEWAPAIAADSGGRIVVAFDSYQAGNYDVLLRSRSADGTLSPVVTVAGSDLYETRPSVAVDPRGRAWVAYEERTPNWGKDAVNLRDGKGSSLYRKAAVKVAVVEGDRVLHAPDPLEHAPDRLKIMNSFPRLLVDRSGRPWLTFRHREEAIWGNNAVMVTGAVWMGHATSLSGSAWSPPQPFTRSDGLLDNRPALVQLAGGPVVAFYATDGRLRREAEMTQRTALKYFSNQGTPPGVFNVDLEVSALAATNPFEEARLSPAPAAAEHAPSVHPNETADLARIRAYRIAAVGKNYRLLRGEFHRHSEISADGGSDGALEDMWRYAIDAAALDWIGNGDHDNGGGKEYTWWLIQKTTDLYTHAPRFVPVFTYERSVVYPHGHRNVMFDHRGVRTLPRLVGDDGVVDEDTLMLYNYLKEHNGICASHTSGTNMGTDWRDTNPTYEPFVEIYQGHRQSYEYLGAPRGARRQDESIGGWRPLGMVWNALAMQYKIGFQASSDHISTHISYGIALAEDTTRPAILDAFRRRHCYAATDNIIMDVRSGEHVMGDEFTSQGPVKLKVFVHGTDKVARVDIIKDFKFAYSAEPNSEQVEFEWTDDEQGRPSGLSWYYVRALQTDGEIAWASPFWVHQP